MKVFLVITGGLLFLISVAAHLYVKIKLRPKQDSDLDEIYWEFEDTHPTLARYNKLCTITFTAATIGALLLFAAVVF
ncbi:MAG: hypothetical protein JW806_00250 [Sedimentisphaerales bacterium]|nr:hypothetical protein [Sedimentisphaerales bacterium]